MYQFIETIQILDGQIFRLPYHNKRMNTTRAHFFHDVNDIDLKDYIVSKHKQSKWKCRVVYTDNIQEISYSPYVMRNTQTLKAVSDNNIDYTYKSTNRQQLIDDYAKRDGQDEVLIVRNGLITDTSFTNVALYDGKNWYTPAHPLLYGTQRASLIDKGIIREKDIRIEELSEYNEICLINAMIDFKELTLPVNRIKLLDKE